MSFHVGQKVVCVDASRRGEGLLTEGDVYVVTALCPPGPNGIPGIQVFGVIAPSTRVDPRKGWMVSRFRPVVERETDISVFTEMLKRWEVPA